MVWIKALRAASAALALMMAPLTGPASAQQGPPPVTQAPETPADPNAQQDGAVVQPIQIPERPALILRGQSKWDDGYKSITDAFVTLRAEAGKARLNINGQPLAVYIQSDDAGFTFEAMLPVDLPPGASPGLANGVTSGRSPGGQALKFEHRGAYDDIESTYEAIAAYLDEKGLTARDELIEEFVNETITADDTNLSIDIYVLLKQ